MMARSRRSNQRPDTVMQDRINQVDEISCTARPDHTVGSKADLMAPKSNFRFAPEGGLRADIASLPFRARTRHGSWQINWAEHLPNHADRLFLGLRDIFGRNRSCDRPADARRS